MMPTEIHSVNHPNEGGPTSVSKLLMVLKDPCFSHSTISNWEGVSRWMDRPAWFLIFISEDTGCVKEGQGQL
jgi:hypothetical protein